MLFNLFISLCFFCTFNLSAAEQSIEVLVKKTEIVDAAPKAGVLDLFMLNGTRQAVTQELLEKKLNSDEFWKKIEEKKMTEVDEVNFFSPAFTSKKLLMKNPVEETPVGTADKTIQLDPFSRANFSYELDSDKLKKIYDETVDMMSIPDVSIKTFYILSDIGIDSEMKWEDVGVSKQENFSGVIVDSWKKWATNSFKNFTNVVVLEKDFVKKPENINPESVTLKWNSTLNRAEVFQDRKSARFEMTSQFILVNTKSGESLAAFDFPNQKREYNISNAKQLSSNLASLIFNLLNSQTSKILTALELNHASSTMSSVEIKVNGRAGLLEISQLNTLLFERFKQIALVSETKSYSSDSSVISIKSTADSVSLYALLAKDGGKFPLNEQKILVFNPADHSFAIISKEANN